MKGAALIAVAATLVVCGCQGKDAPKQDSAKVVQSGTSTPVASRGTFDPATHVAVIHTKDFAFEAPDTIQSGWTSFHLMNDGPALHHVQIVRLDSGKTVADLKQALAAPGAPPRWAVFVGGPNAPDPSSQSEATLNLVPGNYVLLCLVDLGDHVPHFAKGMIRPLTVTAATGPALAEPTADATIDLADYNFALPGTITAGKHTFKVVNKGPQPHEVELARLAPGKTAKDLLAWIDKPEGPPPASAIGGVVAMIPTGTGYFSANLDAGNYALVCFIPDGKDGKPHYAHGMVKDIKVN